MYLADGWELYPDALLTPAELSGGEYHPIPAFIGQYSTLAPFHADGSPYGKVTYRLRLRPSGGQPLSCVLLFQEAASACAVYVNGVLAAAQGGFDPYVPVVADLAVPLVLDGETELVVQAVNYTHYYTGLNYPPALGTPLTSYRAAFLRAAFYGLICFFSLALALYSAAVWILDRRMGREEGFLWFGLLSLSFSLRVLYPFVRAAGLPVILPLYAIEDGAYLFGVWCALKIVLRFSGLDGSRLGRAASPAALHIALAGTVLPLLLPYLPALSGIYGRFVFWYKLLSALLLLALALLGAPRRSGHALWLLAGVSAYGAGLVAHALLLSRYEPALTGWPDEYGTFCLVLCFSVVMALRSRTMVLENRRLTDRLREEVDLQTRRLSSVLEDRRQFLAGAAHDLKAPMTSIQLFAQAAEEGGVDLDTETMGSIRMIRRKTTEMQERLGEIQSFAVQDAQPSHMEPLDLGLLVRAFHEANLPDLEVAGLTSPLCLPRGPCRILGDRTRLDRVLQNVVYNAISFTPMDGEVSLSLETRGEEAVLTVSDTGCGIAAVDLPHVFDRFYSRRTDGDSSGLGLYLARSFVQEHGGEITADSQPGRGTVFTIRLPLLRGP